MTRFLLTLIVVLIIGCEPKNDTETLIKGLSSVQLQTDFLIEISRIDQKVRNDETNILKKYGHDSKEHKESWEVIRRTDDEHLEKIEKYLEVYGHPILGVHGSDATYTPYIVVHHATGGFEPRKRNFKYLYEAYLMKDIKGSTFTFYLNRMYRTKFGERMKYDKPFSEDEEIKALISAMDIDDLALEVETALEIN